MDVLSLLLSAIIVLIHGTNGLNPFLRSLQLQHQEPQLRKDNNRNTDEVRECWLTQQLDHFTYGKSNNQTWSMRYFSNGRYFKPDGPIFIFVGGEWQISEQFVQTGHMYDMAREHGGMLYYTEHRYYGNSLPINNFSTENLKYLNTEQGLADLAHFIIRQKATVPGMTNSKVVLIGGSYSGSLVAWFNKVYPDLVTASWASSAPLKAKLDFYEYMILTGEALKVKGSLKCYNRIESGLRGLTKILNSEEANDLLHRLNICSNFDAKNLLDRITFFNGIGNYFGAIVQSYSDHIPDFCNGLMSVHMDDVEAFIYFLEELFQQYQKESAANYCLDVSYEAAKQIFSDIEDTITGARPWFYQTCNEFGWYATVNETHSNPFINEVPLSYYQKLCQDVFGIEYTMDFIVENVARINEKFDNNFGYEKIYFTNGGLDPWRALSLQNGHNVTIIPDYSHVADLGSIDIADSLQMNMAKLKVATFIKRRLQS